MNKPYESPITDFIQLKLDNDGDGHVWIDLFMVKAIIGKPGGTACIVYAGSNRFSVIGDADALQEQISNLRIARSTHRRRAQQRLKLDD